MGMKAGRSTFATWVRTRLRSERARPISSPSSGAYVIQTSATGGQSNLVGLSVDAYGKMGNNLLQISNAMLLARSLGLEYIRLPKNELFAVDSPASCGELTVLPHDYDTRKLGVFLSSCYFQQARLERLGARMPDRRTVLKKYLMPATNLVSPQAEEPGCLTIHIRSGDIFEENPHRDYAPPPFAFYKLAIERARSRLGIDRVRLVFQDTRNPCVAALQQHLSELQIPVLLQNGNLREDFDVLMSARNLVFGYGTFGVGICLLSDSAETVYSFGRAGRSYAQFTSLSETTMWQDTSGDYPRRGEWRATPDQIDLMIDLPTDVIAETGPPQSPQREIGMAPWWAYPATDL